MEQILSKIDSPADLRKLSKDELTIVCSNLRDFLIHHCACNPGHFGASLGTIELTVALHYVYNTPFDKLVWDVGHQAYAHKIITGRRELFHTNRKHGGLSGFPKIDESEYDAFGVGHASTAISAALGMSIASDIIGENRKTVAVIGDGSLTGGLAYEGLNNAGGTNADILVILNDNDMAIDPNVGALKEYLAKITSSGKYNSLKRNVWDLLGENKVRGAVQRVENTIKSAMLQEGNYFEALGFRYFGPIDGHNLETLNLTLTRLKNIPGPKLLHVVTKKGNGYKPAEDNQTEWHAPGIFDPTTGIRITSPPNAQKPAKYQDVFGETIVELALQNDKIVGVTPAMPTGCSLNIMMKLMPTRAFDVGIAEGHAVTFSAGMATMGLIPFCNIYSSFMQRAFDSVIHDVALQHLKVIFCLDRGGLVGEDGATHHGVYDLAYFRLIPNIIVAAPMDELELRNMMFTATLPQHKAFSIRYPRGVGVHNNWQQPMQEIKIGAARLITTGTDIALLSIGHPGNFAVEAIANAKLQGLSIMHYDMRFLKPIDETVLHQVGQNFKQVITIEDGTVVGGLGTAVADFFATHGYFCKVHKMGVPDKFIEQGTPKELYAECGFDSDGIYNTIIKLWKEK